MCNAVRDPNTVGRAVQTSPTLLRYASAITEQKKCWELLAPRVRPVLNFAQQLPTTCKSVFKRTQHVTMLRLFARGLEGWGP